MASLLSGYLSPGLTAASEAVAGAQRGDIEGNEILAKRFVQNAAIKHREEQDRIAAIIAAARVQNYGSLSDARLNGVTYREGANGDLVGLPKVVGHDSENPSAGPGQASASTVTDSPSAGAKASASSAHARTVTSIATGVKVQVKPTPYSPEAIAADSAKAANRRHIAVDNPLPSRAPYSASPIGQTAQEKKAHDQFIMRRIIAYMNPQYDTASHGIFKQAPLSNGEAAQRAIADAKASGLFPHIYGQASSATAVPQSQVPAATPPAPSSRRAVPDQAAYDALIAGGEGHAPMTDAAIAKLYDIPSAIVRKR
jgi:hypothetical protein